jgi:hypothetical protein
MKLGTAAALYDTDTCNSYDVAYVSASTTTYSLKTNFAVRTT